MNDKRGLKSKHYLYASYASMLTRCNNPARVGYERYGGRGIKVCERWQGKEGFWNFVKDLGPRPTGYSLERKDNDKGYSPENCKWATRVEQQSNKRSNKYLIFCGERITMAEAGRRAGLQRSLLSKRVAGGWDYSKTKEGVMPDGWRVMNPVAPVKYRGRVISLFKACKGAGISYGTALSRIKKGWTDAEALEIPARGNRVAKPS